MVICPVKNIDIKQRKCDGVVDKMLNLQSNKSSSKLIAYAELHTLKGIFVAMIIIVLISIFIYLSIN